MSEMPELKDGMFVIIETIDFETWKPKRDVCVFFNNEIYTLGNKQERGYTNGGITEFSEDIIMIFHLPFLMYGKVCDGDNRIGNTIRILSGDVKLSKYNPIWIKDGIKYKPTNAQSYIKRLFTRFGGL